MSREINKEILEKLGENEDISLEVKRFIFKALKIEYSKVDKNEHFKKEYLKLINEFIRDEIE